MNLSSGTDFGPARNRWTQQTAVFYNLLIMAYGERLQKFSKTDFLPEGWYWLLRSRDLKKKSALPVKLWKRDFVVFRGTDGKARVLDAHCPHMGAHLCDGKVEENS